MRMKGEEVSSPSNGRDRLVLLFSSGSDWSEQRSESWHRGGKERTAARSQESRQACPMVTAITAHASKPGSLTVHKQTFARERGAGLAPVRPDREKHSRTPLSIIMSGI